MNINSLSASNGSGEAVRATVQAPGRAIGATAIPVNATTNWPTGTFIATTGTLLSTGVLNPTTVQVFYGTASGTTITITSFAPGYTDKGNSVNDIVVIKPTTEWSNIIATVVSTFHPVNSIYIETSGVNPATTFGFGTWVATGAGRMLIGAGTSDQTFTAGATGGESNHTLSVGEMPVHTHSLTDPGHYHQEQVATTGGGGLTGITGTSSLMGNTGSSQDTTVKTTGISIGDAGSGAAHNNLSPYLVVYMWKRTA